MKRNMLIFFMTIGLCLFGLLMIYSSSCVIAEYKFNNPYKYVFHQSIFFLIGLVLLIVLSKTDYHFNYLKKSQKSPQMLLPPLFLPLLP